MESDYAKAIVEAKSAVQGARHAHALDVLAGALTPEAPFSVLLRAAKWCAAVDWPFDRRLKAAVLGGGTLDNLVDMTRFWLTLRRVQASLYRPDYGTWRQQVLDPASGLYSFAPEIVWLFTGWRDLEGAGEGNPAQAIENFRALWGELRRRIPGVFIVQNNADEPLERVFGNYDVMLAQKGIAWFRTYNEMLIDAAREDGVLLFDLAHLAAEFGLRSWHDARYWFLSKHPFAPGLVPAVGYDVAQTLLALKGGSRKCLVLDLDNTLWGGVIGDDGISGVRLGDGADGEAFAAFQDYLKKLAARGVVLAVCSKNDDENAREPFLKHPGMRLRLEDIAVFKANWNSKADNIREIASLLNLGLDSLVFLDDNPAERAHVRAELPMVAVPELPNDPAECPAAIDRLRLFETVTFSEEDVMRSRMYRENTARTEARASSTDLCEYLRDLEMTAEVGTADAFHLPRMAQLVNKTNQFHPTTTRYSETEIAESARRDDCAVRWFALRDRFGDNGLIAVLVLRRDGDAFVIDTWAMSCRVLSRGMEEFICRELVDLARAAGVKKLRGVYKPTRKNGLVAELYGRLGFSMVETHAGEGTLWELKVADYLPARGFIAATRAEEG